jgi:hypothetical protein
MQKWVFNFGIWFLIDLFSCFWRFLALCGGYWTLFEEKYWEEVGRWLPTSDIYKAGILEAMGGGSK